MADPNGNTLVETPEEARAQLKHNDAASQVFEWICLPATEALNAMTPPDGVMMREWAVGLAAAMPARFQDLRSWSIPKIEVETVVQVNETWAVYDRYFGVVRNRKKAAETLISACAKTLRDIKETSAHGHDLSDELQADLLEGIKIVLELVNE